MNTQEIMVIRNDRLKIFAVDNLTLSKLIQIRGNLYRDNPKLRAMANTPEPQIDPERKAYLDAAYQRYMAEQAAKASQAMPQPQPERPQTPEDAWRCSPALRQEFTSLASYQAYLRAVQEGRAKVYGGVS